MSTTRTPTHQPTATPPQMMRANIRERYGPVGTVSVRDDVPVPRPGPNEVLIEVHAAGVDRGVVHLVTGLPYVVRLAGYGVRRPKQPVPGTDVAGRVVAVGDQVEQTLLGAEVFGFGSGTFAEYAVARADRIVRKPGGLSFAEAAVIPVSGITAQQALHAAGKVRPGQRVLVLGASGGVGGFAVQLAVAAGAEVTGVASGAKAELVRTLGARRVIDYRTTDVTAEAHVYDLIIDTGGRTPVRRLRRILAPRGTLVLVGGENGGRWTGGFGRHVRAAALSAMPWVRQRLVMLMSSENGAELDRLRTTIQDVDLRPAVGRRYRLEEATQALTDLDAGHASGKSVIEVRP